VGPSPAGEEEQVLIDAVPAALDAAMMMCGLRLSRAVYVVARLGIADLLRKGPMSCRKLAARCGAHARSVYRVMRALSPFGFFIEDRKGRFALGSVGLALCSDTADTLLPAVVAMGGEWHWRLWGDLFRSVQTGEPAWSRLFGADFIESCKTDRALGRMVNSSRSAIYTRSDEAVLDAYDFARCRCVVEVALQGGCGTLLARILGKHIALRGVLYDLPAALEGMPERLRALGLEERCLVIGGDCRESVPAGGDAYLLRGVVHNLADETAVSVMRHCRGAMAEGGRLFVCEMLIPQGNGFFVGKLIDLESLLLTAGARERSEGELRALIEAAGFHVTKVIGTTVLLSVVEATRD